jgi:hypothetical protein
MPGVCECGHAVFQHIAYRGVCTGPCCPCGGYVARPRVIGVEARSAVQGLFHDGVIVEGYALELVQDLIDARLSWEADAARLLAQRDYADRRATAAEARIADAAQWVAERRRRFKAADLDDLLAKLGIKP